MNYMAEVAKMLGVKLGEEFDVDVHGTIVKAKITQNDICLLGSPHYLANYNASTLLRNLLCGRYVIHTKPWKPQKHEEYWTVMRDGEVFLATWLNDLIDIHCYKLGNCYRTKEEAETNRDKWISFYSSDEVLEVLR